MRLEGKTAIVTGGSRGIGRACVARLAAEGATVALLYHSNQQAADAVVAELKSATAEVRAFQADVRDLQRAHQIVDQLFEEWGKIDPVVQFVVHTVMGQMLCRTEQDPAGLEHLAKATDLLEKASARCSPAYSYHVNQVYRLRVEACLLFGRQDEAKQTALVGTKQLMTGKRFDE